MFSFGLQYGVILSDIGFYLLMKLKQILVILKVSIGAMLEKVNFISGKITFNTLSTMQ